MPLPKLRGASSEKDAEDKEGLKRQCVVLIGKSKVQAPEATGREVSGCVKDGHRIEKNQEGAQDVRALTGTIRDSFLVAIEFVASDSTAIDITSWNDYVAQRLLGCSMKAFHSGFVVKGGDGSFLLSDGLKEVTGLVKKR